MPEDFSSSRRVAGISFVRGSASWRHGGVHLRPTTSSSMSCFMSSMSRAACLSVATPPVLWRWSWSPFASVIWHPGVIRLRRHSWSMAVLLYRKASSSTLLNNWRSITCTAHRAAFSGQAASHHPPDAVAVELKDTCWGWLLKGCRVREEMYLSLLSLGTLGIVKAGTKEADHERLLWNWRNLHDRFCLS